MLEKTYPMGKRGEVIANDPYCWPLRHGICASPETKEEWIQIVQLAYERGYRSGAGKWRARIKRWKNIMPTPKFPNIKVRLLGEDGNAFAILGSVIKALKLNRVPEREITAFREQATSGDYNKLLRICMEWVDVR